MCILRLREHSHDGVRKEQISKTGMGTLSKYYSQFLHHYRYLVTQLIHMHIDLLLNSSKRCGTSSYQQSAYEHFKRKNGIFARPGHRSQRRILLPATAPMNHLSSCSEGTKATCRRNCIYTCVCVNN